MIYKIYEKIKQFILENYLYLLLYIVLISVLTYPLPYYIYTGGGLMDVSSKISIQNNNKINGSYNMCYVKELEATIPTYLFSFLNSSWDMISKNDVTYDKNETKEDVIIRDKIYLDTSKESAIINAFKYANMDYEVLSSKPIVIYVMEEARSNLEVGDEILSINNKLINSRDDIVDLIKDYHENSKLDIKVRNNNKEYDRYAYVIVNDDTKMLGTALEVKSELKTDPKIDFNFSDSESGPSGGFILSLALYDYLTDYDLAKGLKISGTGTIDQDGNVGEIGGVKYKLKGAVKNKADIFFVPSGENYDEAISLQKKYNYKIKIIGVSSFNDALNYLRNS